MRTTILAAGLSAALLSSPVMAQEDSSSGNWLYDLCTIGSPGTNVDDAFKYGMCLGYVTGVADAVYAEDIDSDCLVGTTRGQLVDTVRLYLEQHPQDRHYPAFLLAQDALRIGFGCQEGVQ
jgi:hypothetical protein